MAEKSIIRRIVSSPMVQIFLVYASGGWGTLELLSYLINNYGLNDRIKDIVGLILLIGLPIAVFLAWYLNREIPEESSKTEKGDEDNAKGRNWKSTLYFGIGLALVIFGVIYFIWIKQDLPAYIRASLEFRSEKAGNKAKKARTLKNVRANALYIYESYEGNDFNIPSEIVNEYHHLLEEHPESSEAHLYLGEAYFFSSISPASGDHALFRDSAWILINKAQDMGLSSFDAENINMYLYMELNLGSRVKASAEMLVNDYPDEPGAWINAGEIFLKQFSDTLQTIKYYQKALEIYPRTINSFTRLASIYIAQQKYDLALDLLNAALKINPNDPAIANGYISYFKNSGRSNETAGFLEHTIKKYNIKSIYYDRDLAQIYIMNNDTAKARAFIEATLDQYPDDNELLDWKNELRRIISFDKEGSDLNVSQSVTWYEDFEEALAKAKKEGKPILTQFYDHKNDYLFQKMNRDIFSDSSIQVILKEFVPVRLSESSNPELFKEYGINFTNNDLKIISSDKVLLENIDRDITYPEEALSALRKGLERFKHYQFGRKMNSEEFIEVSNFADAKLLSEAKKFPIMVVISNENLPYSKRLVNETLQDPIFKSEFYNVVYFKISPERNQNLIESWNVRIFPSILFFNSKGEMIHCCYGYKTPESLAVIVRKVKDTYSKGELYAPEVNWFYNLKEAEIAAQIEHKYIFVASEYFMNRPKVFIEPEVVKKLNDFICISIEDVKDLELLSQYGRLHSTLCFILDPSGNEKLKSVGLFEKEKLLKWLDIEQEMTKMSLLGPEKYKNYRDQIDLAEAMEIDTMPRNAISIYKTLLEIFPDDLDIIQKLGDLYLDIKDAGMAIKYFQMEAEINPDYSDLLLENMIQSYLQLGRHQELKEWFEYQINTNEGNDPKQARLYRYYSELSEILMDSVKAREYAFKAIQINADDFKSYTHLGILLYYYGDYNLAKKYLLTATRSNDESAIAYTYLALIADDFHEIDEKERNMDIVFEQSSYSPDIILNNYQNRSRFYSYPGYTFLIKKNLSDRFRIASNDIYYNRYYSQFLVDYSNDHERALQLVDRCIKEQPEDFTLQENKAWILYKMDQVTEADSCITRCLKNEGDRYIERSLSTLYHTGKIKLAVGDTIQGLEYLRETQKFRFIAPMEEFIVDDVNSILKEAS